MSVGETLGGDPNRSDGLMFGRQATACGNLACLANADLDARIVNPAPLAAGETCFPEQHRTKLHSTNPLERLNKEVKAACRAVRNVGLLEADSARALKVADTSFAVLLHQPGMRPQRIGTSSRPLFIEADQRITSTVSVGVML
jgi:hypothetical protein